MVNNLAQASYFAVRRPNSAIIGGADAFAADGSLRLAGPRTDSRAPACPHAAAA